MLPKERRVNSRQFKTLLNRGRNYHQAHLSLRAAKGAVSSPSSFAFVVSSAVAKKAVRRNTLKRRGRAVVEKLLPSLVDGYQCVFFFKKGADVLVYKDIEMEIRDLLNQASVLSSK